MNNLDPKSNKKIKLSSAQIAILEKLSLECGRYVRKTAFGFEIRDMNFNWSGKVRSQTVSFLIKHSILIASIEGWILNPEIKGWEHIRKHLRPDHNPKVNWYNHGK